ncbi:Sucraseferredoxin-like protein [Metschnikowia bicuspidata var. bicuspidata NRRL YB-4993]|uniref:Sucraseferredoxin-like protein n=1 Tax=Metschnikowia bicuspidata var. bicuspidata NRRL YB-4993 TaxID=869754 RepID=A0A1A0HHL8_9ASCO|nr:Sucraseferredoxin-like protein [Metschnikowia bicuspidata var. bicuspidata NRRL YB-4993]OBA23500.1 Sucraseferredoxin-like protein [Metschnikowia bicuspidata var. bicuspidata NRRL YB-4993]
MGFSSFFKRGPSAEQQIQDAGFEISECSEECETCTSSFPKSLSFKDDDSASLFGSTSPYGLHVVVPTNRSDWAHDATGKSGTLAHTVAKWAGSAKFPGLGENSKIKVTVSSLSSLKLETDAEYMDQKRGDVLLLPFFVWVRNISLESAPGVLDKVVPSLINFRDQGLADLPALSYSGFPEVDIRPDPSKSYVFLCSHRTRDKKCGVTAPIMKREMDMHLRDVGLYRDTNDDRPGGVQVAFVNHIGGHKYAANVLIYNKNSGKNIWLARCRPQNVVPIIDECVIGDGKVWPNKVRQVQKFKAIEW